MSNKIVWPGPTRKDLAGNIEFCTTTIEAVIGCRMGCRDCSALRDLRAQAPAHGVDPADPMRPHPNSDAWNKLITADEDSVFMLCPRGEFFDPEVPTHYRSRCYDFMRSPVSNDRRYKFFLFTKRFDAAYKSLQVTDRLDNVWLVFSVSTQSQADRAWRVLRKIKTVQHVGLSISPIHEDIRIPWCMGDQPDWVLCGGNQIRKVPGTHLMAKRLMDQCRRRGIRSFFKGYGFHNIPAEEFIGEPILPDRHPRAICGKHYNTLPDGRKFEKTCLSCSFLEARARKNKEQSSRISEEIFSA